MSEQTPRQVRFYLDFISPYTYLALTRAHDLAQAHDFAWIVHPVAYGAILDETGLIGPVETPLKRRYTYRDVMRCSQLLGVPLVGPPQHPFRSLEALRTLCIYRDDPSAVELAVRLATACWGEGVPLTDPAALAEIVAGQGLDAARLRERIQEDSVKRDLHDLTREALDHGVFGVPTFEYDGELFWGHDRLDHLTARLCGQLAEAGPDLDEIARRPSGAVRKGAPAKH